MTTIPFPVGEESVVVERRASAWTDPRTWVSICGVLLTLCSIVGGYIAKELSTINTSVQNLSISTAQITSKQAEEISNLKEAVRDLQTKVTKSEADQTAYNYDLMRQLTRLQAAADGKKK